MRIASARGELISITVGVLSVAFGSRCGRWKLKRGLIVSCFRTLPSIETDRIVYLDSMSSETH